MTGQNKDSFLETIYDIVSQYIEADDDIEDIVTAISVKNVIENMEE